MRRAPTLIRRILLLILALIVTHGCQRTSPKSPGARASGHDAPQNGQELRVFAASSLTESFQEIARAFEKAHPEVNITLHFAGSQALRTQIENGAPADVFASANPAHLDALLIAKLLQTPSIFAYNRLVIVTPAQNPASIESVQTLPHARRLVVGSAEVPIGRYTRQFLQRAADSFGDDYREEVERDIVSHEANVRLILTKVAMGEADAGIVYHTDARVRGDQVRTVAIPANLNIRADYPIAVTTGSENPVLARRWVEFVRSSQGQKILAARGFDTATPILEQPP